MVLKNRGAFKKEVEEKQELSQAQEIEQLKKEERRFEVEQNSLVVREKFSK